MQWDRPPAEGGEDPGWGHAGSDSEDELGPEDCQEALASMLANLYFEGKLSAKNLCVLSFWAVKSGAKGQVEDFAMHPKASTGHYQRHLDSALGLKEHSDKLFWTRCPWFSKSTATREPHDLAVLPPHEALYDEIQSNPGARDKLEAELAEGGLAQAFLEHPIYTGRLDGEPVYPVAIFVDGVPFTKRDSLLAFYSYNLCTGVRHLNAVLRRSWMCKCGCRGWCTIWAVFRFLEWSLSALARGVFPSSGVAGEAFEADSERALRSGRPLGFKAAVVQIRGDWAEFAHSFGFAAWNSARFPCLLCDCDSASMYNIESWSLASTPFGVHTKADYEAECQRCEIKRVVSKQDWVALAPKLRFDKRKTGLKGRGLLEDFPSLRLLAGDRLEPSEAVPDIGAVDATSQFPLELTFWRTSVQRGVLHRMPLFTPLLGLSPDSFALDLLHTLHLGIMNRYVCCCIWRLFRADVWNVVAAGAAHTADEALQMNCMRFRADLFDWYRARQRAHPAENLTRLEDITPGMVGSNNAPLLKAKGAETKGLLLFVVEKVGALRDSLDQGPILKAAGVELVTFLRLIDEFPPVLTPRQHQDEPVGTNVCAPSCLWC